MYIGDKMSIWALFSNKNREFEQKKQDLELNFIRERNEQDLELKRRKKELWLRVDEKKAQLDEELLNYKIEEARAKLEEALGYDEGDEESEGNAADNMLLQLGTKLLSANSPHPSESEPPKTQIQETSKQSLSDEEIKIIWQTLPADKKALARIASDSQKREFLIKNYPNIDLDSIDRAIKLIKEKI